jgi:hypothetical protein
MASPALHNKLLYFPGDKAVLEKQNISLQLGRWVSMSYLNITQLYHRWLPMFLPSFLSTINVRKVISHKKAACVSCAKMSPWK